MLFRALAPFLLFLIGCASINARSGDALPVAYLSFVPSADESGRSHGQITAVDHHHLAGDSKHRVRLSHGAHSIGFYCANFIYLHFEPRLDYRFRAGVSYALTCNSVGWASIRPL